MAVLDRSSRFVAAESHLPKTVCRNPTPRFDLQMIGPQILDYAVDEDTLANRSPKEFGRSAPEQSRTSDAKAEENARLCARELGRYLI
jgi:hypothetical protein